LFYLYSSAISSEVQEGKIPVTLALEQSVEDMQNNKSVTVNFSVALRNNILTLDRGKSFEQLDRQAVYLLEGDELTLKNVEFGLVTKEKLEVVNGLKSGDKVVISNVDAMQQESLVKIRF
jgi:HlyD family secretion protein